MSLRHWYLRKKNDRVSNIINKNLEPRPEFGGLSRQELESLATYNHEVNQGLLHSEEWKEKMRNLQERFDSGIRSNPNVTIVDD